MEKGVESMIEREGQALLVAVAMEKRAIRIYERARLLAKEAATRAAIDEILSQERQHLARFQAMRQGEEAKDAEDALLADALAGEVLFPGGVMAFQREAALDHAAALYEYAAESEAEAVRTYTALAQRCDSLAVQEEFLAIAREEGNHLSAFRLLKEEAGEVTDAR